MTNNSQQTEWSRQGSKRRRIRAKFMAQARSAAGLECSFCHQPISPDRPHLDAAELVVDHVVPLSAGGAPFDSSNLAPAHRHCNRQAGDKRSTGTSTGTYSHEPDSAPPKGLWQLHPDGSVPTEDHPLTDDRGALYYLEGKRIYKTTRTW